MDPIDFTVINSKLHAIAWEMKDVMLLASRNAILTAAQDFSVGVVDKDGNPLITPDLIPIQMYGIHYAIYPIIEAYKGDIHPEIEFGVGLSKLIAEEIFGYRKGTLSLPVHNQL